MATPWTKEQKRQIPSQGVTFNQAGVTFNQVGILFGGNNPTTTWTFEAKTS